MTNKIIEMAGEHTYSSHTDRIEAVRQRVNVKLESFTWDQFRNLLIEEFKIDSGTALRMVNIFIQSKMSILEVAAELDEVLLRLPKLGVAMLSYFNKAFVDYFMKK
ncbi:MAG: hypothetical protein HZA34_02220 [Candidatus Pacebacteria bacterium]|nr:hypothetical protein [Candidatus Paceibacterota bacterium]